jgi:predicted O-methyltransferase YrrM
MKLRRVIKALLSPRHWYEEKIRLIHQLAAELQVSQVRLAEVSKERDVLQRRLDDSDAVQFYPPGHFYSPVPSKRDVQEYLGWKEQRGLIREFPAIQMDDKVQLQMLDSLKPYYPLFPFQAEPVDGLLYHFNNPNYSHTDGIILFCMLNRLRPRRVIEIGSGFSTCAILDTNRLFLQSQMRITSIEPHPELLRSLIANSTGALTIVESRLQDADIKLFDQLEPGDILFIDSTHISKVGSDVNYVIFEILPRLKTGVIIQIHDIYANFEYPDVWAREGRAWNEAYLLRAFMEYNEHFRILLFISYLQNAYQAWFQEHMPKTLLNYGGCFWMEKV